MVDVADRFDVVVVVVVFVVVGVVVCRCLPFVGILRCCWLRCVDCSLCDLVVVC